jgi:glycosyltransferase involved in cell wall biosynthesis
VRLLQTYSKFSVGGTERHVIALSCWLRAQGHHVSIAGAPGHWLDERRDPDFLALALDEVTEAGGHMVMRLAQAVRCAAKLRHVLRRQQIDLVHAHETAPAIVARLAAIGMKIPIVLTYHGSDDDRVPWFGRVGRLVAHRIVTPSESTAANLHEHGGVPRSMIHVIGLGVDSAPEFDRETIAQCRKELLDRDGRLLVVTVARMTPQKGIDILVDSARRVIVHRPDVRFVVVGDGPLLQDAKLWAAQARIERYVRFVGGSETPHLYLSAADLFVLSSRWEALPLSIVEAFHAGLPIIATNAGGVRELVDPAVGRIVPIADPTALANAILEICNDDKLRRTLSAEARKRGTEQRFSPDYINRLLELTYAEILCKPLPAAGPTHGC